MCLAWTGGHSCIEDVVEMAEKCRVKHTYIGHHDPNRDWSERNWIDEILNRKSEQIGLQFELARAENRHRSIVITGERLVW